MSAPLDRRSFFGVGGAALLLCTIDGKQVAVRTPEDVEKVDAAMASLRRPKSAQRSASARHNPTRSTRRASRAPSLSPAASGASTGSALGR